MTWEQQQQERMITEERRVAGITATAERMKMNALNVRVQEEGCRAVSRALWERRVTPGKVISSGALDAVLAAMKQHRDAPAVQAKGCHILHHLCKSNTATCETVAARGGIEQVLGAVARHPDNPDVQSFGCGALWNLAMVPGTAGAVAIRLGGVELVLELLAAPYVVEKTLEYGIGALSGMLRNGNPVALRAFCAGKGVDAVLNAMRTHPNNVYLQRNGCLVLAYACEESVKCQRALLAAKGLILVAETLLRYYQNDITFDNACRAIIAIFAHEVPPSAQRTITPELVSLLERQCTGFHERGRGTQGAAAASRNLLCIHCLEILRKHEVIPRNPASGRRETTRAPVAASTQSHHRSPVDDDAALLDPESILLSIYGSRDDGDDEGDTASGESSPHSPVHELEQDEGWEQLGTACRTQNPFSEGDSGSPTSVPFPEAQPQLMTPVALRNVLLSPTSDRDMVCYCLGVLEQRLRKGKVSAHAFVRFGDLDAVLTVLRRFSADETVEAACTEALQAAAAQHDTASETVHELERLKEMEKIVAAALDGQ